MIPLRVDYQRLVALFRRAALIAAPAASLGLSACGPCPPVDRIFLLRNPDAETQALIDACRDPVDSDCEPLCQKLMGQSGFREFEHCELHADSDGYVVVHVGYQPVCPGGRRPQRLALDPPDAAAETPAGAWFAGLFQLEAASVPAFRTLRDELAQEGAPARLQRAAACAARDERRHARLAGALALRFGGRPRSPRVAPTPPRSLAAMAEENAVEGCVREAYGALLAGVQARASSDPVVRAVLGAVARDETRHAALAFAVDRWARSRLSPRSRRRLEDARDAAIDELARRAGEDWTSELGSVAGLPDPAVSRVLVGTLGRTLWRTAA
jgi:hypothetical protein